MGGGGGQDLTMDLGGGWGFRLHSTMKGGATRLCLTEASSRAHRGRTVPDQLHKLRKGGRYANIRGCRLAGSWVSFATRASLAEFLGS